MMSTFQDISNRDLAYYSMVTRAFSHVMVERLVQHHERGNGDAWGELDEDELLNRAGENLSRVFYLMGFEKGEDDLDAHMERVADQVADVANLLMIATQAHYGRLLREQEAERESEAAEQESLHARELERMVNEGGHE